MTENVIYLREFLLENYDTLFNPDIVDHSMDKKKIEFLKQALHDLPDSYEGNKTLERCVGIYKQVSECIFNNIQYISFQDYFDRLRRVCSDIVKFIQKEQKQVVFMIPNFNKSSFWVFLLCCHFFDGIPFQVMKQYPSEGLHNTIIIYPDDMSYSGAQLVNHVKTYQVRIRDPEKVDREVRMSIDSMSEQKTDEDGYQMSEDDVSEDELYDELFKTIVSQTSDMSDKKNQPDPTPYHILKQHLNDVHLSDNIENNTEVAHYYSLVQHRFDGNRFVLLMSNIGIEAVRYLNIYGFRDVYYLSDQTEILESAMNVLSRHGLFEPYKFVESTIRKYYHISSRLDHLSLIRKTLLAIVEKFHQYNVYDHFTTVLNEKFGSELELELEDEILEKMLLIYIFDVLTIDNLVHDLNTANRNREQYLIHHMIYFQNSLDLIDESHVRKRYDELNIHEIYEPLLYRFDQLYSLIHFTIQLRKIFTYTFEFNTLVCFQHKMADSVSIPMFLFHNGVYLQYDNHYFIMKHIGSLFKNCIFDPYEIVEMVKEDIPEEKRCPPTYYKHIVYTYKGNIIYPEMLDNIYFLMEPVFTQVPPVHSSRYMNPRYEDRSSVYIQNPLGNASTRQESKRTGRKNAKVD